MLLQLSVLQVRKILSEGCLKGKGWPYDKEEESQHLAMVECILPKRLFEKISHESVVEYCWYFDTVKEQKISFLGPHIKPHFISNRRRAKKLYALSIVTLEGLPLYFAEQCLKKYSEAMKSEVRPGFARMHGSLVVLSRNSVRDKSVLQLRQSLWEILRNEKHYVYILNMFPRRLKVYVNYEKHLKNHLEQPESLFSHLLHFANEAIPSESSGWDCHSALTEVEQQERKCLIRNKYRI